MARQRRKSLTDEQVDSVCDLIPHIPHLKEMIEDDVFWRRFKALAGPWVKWVVATFLATETGLHVLQSLMARVLTGGGGLN